MLFPACKVANINNHVLKPFLSGLRYGTINIKPIASNRRLINEF